MQVIERMESSVRGYCRSFPTVFSKARGHEMIDREGRRYVDFFAGAGALNYGHNPPELKERLIEYLSGDNPVHMLDMATEAKEHLLETIDSVLLRPRGMEYRVMFPGPTGTNAVEAALKLARKVTGRTGVISFTNGFHGMTLGSLALTGNGTKRAGAGVSLGDVTHMPFCGYLGMETDTIDLLETYLSDSSSGVAEPAAIVLETVQAEGGVNVASREWLQRIAEVARRHGALLIVDDIQVGCGRTGSFFSFEQAGLKPDLVCLSKSFSGYGLPLAALLIRPELDQFSPGEHNGTFRGHNPAFVTAAAALEVFWQDDALTTKVNRNAAVIRDFLLELADRYGGEVRGRGMIQGIELPEPSDAGKISQAAFQRGLIIETAGPLDQVVKLLPPLTITTAGLAGGLRRLRESFAEVLDRTPGSATSGAAKPASEKATPASGASTSGAAAYARRGNR
jgi:diaminobutyrate-2-oxoglutarate transaminase